MKKFFARNNILKKRIPNMRFWIIYVLVQISFFGNSERKKEKDQEEIKIELQKKLHRRIHVRDITSWLQALLSTSFFVAFFVYSLLFPSDVLAEWPLYKKILSIAMGVILCDGVMSERSKTWKCLSI